MATTTNSNESVNRYIKEDVTDFKKFPLHITIPKIVDWLSEKSKTSLNKFPEFPPLIDPAIWRIAIYLCEHFENIFMEINERYFYTKRKNLDFKYFSKGRIVPYLKKFLLNKNNKNKILECLNYFFFKLYIIC